MRTLEFYGNLEANQLLVGGINYRIIHREVDI